MGRLWLSDLVSSGLLFDPKPQIGSVVQGLGSGEGLSSSVTILHFNNWRLLRAATFALRLTNSSSPSLDRAQPNARTPEHEI